jgi:pilus assembly protein CpaB
MKPKTMMLMVVAIGCGLAASYMTSRLLAERKDAAVEEEKVTVLAAKIKVPAWVSIKEPEKYFELKEVPVSVAPKKGLKEFKDVKGQRLSQGLSEGEYLLEDKLVNPEQVGLIAKLPPGMRAIAIKVNAESLAGGFVLPGYRVDVVSTKRGGNNESEARIILQNMLVLAVDTVANRDTQTTSMLGSTVTLAATPEEANRLSLSSVLGELRLTLRTPEDNKIVRLPGSRAEDLGRPIRDAVDGIDDEANLVSAAPVPKLPDLPKDAPQSLNLDKPVEAKVEQAPALETHTMTIVTGEFTQKAVFTFDPQANVWANGSLNRGAAELPPHRAPAPAAAPNPPAAPNTPAAPNADAPPAPAPVKTVPRGRIG